MMENFEERLKRLEELADQVRNREVSLDQAMKLYREGMRLSKELEEELTGFEREVEMLSNEPPSDGSGDADLAPFDAESPLSS